MAEAKGDDEVKKSQVVEVRGRNISHNVRCTECGSQSIVDSQADIPILLRKLIHDEIRSGKSDKDTFKKLEDEYGETVLYTPKSNCRILAITNFMRGAAARIASTSKRLTYPVVALNLVRGVPFAVREKETVLDFLTPLPSRGGSLSSLWKM